MEIVCTRPNCPRPKNHFPDLNSGTLTTVQQKFCTACGMPLILSGRYLPEKLLGKGGFGAAFLARDRYTPAMRPCVVKLFQPSGDLSPDQMQIAQSLFQREAAVLEDLGNRHKQIPDLFAFFPLIVPGRKPGVQEEYFYLVQEYIDGEDLEQILKRQGALPTAEVITILVSMLKVLDFVHANGTIHRDIKPSNIMHHRNGLLYLLDFGAVKQVTSAQGTPGGRSTGIYSVGYAPPEQMAGGQVYPSTDLYALAVTCIVLLTGKEVGELYDSFNNTWAWHTHVQDSLAIAPVLDRMLQATPNQRYSSAQDVLDALEKMVSSPSPPPPPPPPPRGKSGSKTGSGTSLQPGGPSGTPTQPPTPPPKGQPLQPVAPTAISSVPLLTFLGGAAFTGVEGGLLAIAIVSWLSTTWLGSGAWLFLVGGLLLL
ncbi:MAG: serine/threonine-protein kinase, partial [Cyanobacteria bacterium J06626_18]